MFTVRTATGQDIAALDALFARAYPRLLKGDYPPSLLVMALPIISRAQPDLITCGTFYVVEEEGTILGAGGWTAHAPSTRKVTRGVGHIRHVVTDDRATRRGVGRGLMAHIFDQTRRQGLRRLKCMSTLTAEPFYKAVGFSSADQVVIPLGPGIDFPAVEMTRSL